MFGYTAQQTLDAVQEMYEPVSYTHLVLIYQKTEETAGEIRQVAAKSQNKNNV